MTIPRDDDGTVRLWNATTYEPVATIDATKAEVRPIALLGDGLSLAAGFRYGAVPISDHASYVR
jgi:WD40 repeat protein